MSIQHIKKILESKKKKFRVFSPTFWILTSPKIFYSFWILFEDQDDLSNEKMMKKIYNQMKMFNIWEISMTRAKFHNRAHDHNRAPAHNRVPAHQ